MASRAVLLVFPVLLALAGPALCQECDETFDYPSGSLPPSLISTRDPSDSGEFAVREGALEHTEDGSAHYVYKGCPYDVDVIEFDVRGGPWSFAWEISSEDSLQGTCQRLFHEEQATGWVYGSGQCSWSVPAEPPCPDCSFTWQHCDPVSTSTSLYHEQAVGWHHVRIENDILGRVSVYQVFLDGELLITASYETPLTGTSYQGFGCPAVSGSDPAFDNLVVEHAVPVENFSWGGVKALYRGATQPN